MSKKNKNYNPRHVKGDRSLSGQSDLQQQSSKRYVSEAQLSEGYNGTGKSSSELNQHYPSKKLYPSYVRIPAAEETASPAADKEADNAAAAPTKEPIAKADAAAVKADAAVKEEGEAAPVLQAEAANPADSVPSAPDESTPDESAPDESASDESAPDESASDEAPLVDPEELNSMVVSVVPAQEASPEEMKELYGEDPEPDQKPDRKTKRKKRWKRAVIIAVSIPLALIIALVGTFFVMREIGRRDIHQDNSKKIELNLPTEDGFDKQVSLGDRYGRIISYKGTSYIYDNDVVTLTFIGADNGHGAEKNLKMADSIYVIAINTKTGKIKMLNVSRDIMTDVDVYSIEGKFIDTEEIQISYSNAYYGEGITGGDNTNRSLSRLMFGLPLENYFEFDLGAVSKLNDAIGGVTVTSAMTFTSPEDGRTINEGDVVTLHGKEAEYYTRHRDTTKLTSNNDRMKRQQDYIMSFLQSIVPVAKKDVSVISELYNTVSENSQTSLNASELVYLASTAVTNLNSLSDIEFVKFNGKITAGVNAEMRVTNDEVLSKMLQVFYKPLNLSSTDATDDPGAAANPSENQAADTSAAPSQTDETKEPNS